MSTQHPAYATEFPPSDSTFTGRVAMLFATGREDAVDDLVAEVVDEPEEMFPDDPAAQDLDEDSADELVERVREAYATAVPEPSADVEALDSAFAALADQGIALSLGEGWDAQEGADFGHEAAQELDGAVGYAYAHVQDLERAVETGELLLGFSDLEGDLDSGQAARIGETIVAALREQGLTVTWSGRGSDRITVGPICYAVPVE